MLAAVAPEDAHTLAARFMDRMNMGQTMLDALAGDRANAIADLRARGLTGRQAGVVFDRYMLPEMRRRFPELRAQLVDIMARTFTGPELEALAYDQQNEARQSAAAKITLLRARFHEAGEAWGAQLGRDVTDNNAAALHRLGVNN